MVWFRCGLLPEVHVLTAWSPVWRWGGGASWEDVEFLGAALGRISVLLGETLVIFHGRVVMEEQARCLPALWLLVFPCALPLWHNATTISSTMRALPEAKSVGPSGLS